MFSRVSLALRFWFRWRNFLQPRAFLEIFLPCGDAGMQTASDVTKEEVMSGFVFVIFLHVTPK